MLKALLLVKHVEGFTANVRNLRILILDRFDENIPELEQHIRDTLDTLERQNYVHRTGDVYEYLTNDEQAIENEIKNVDVEDRQIRSSHRQDHQWRHSRLSASELPGKAGRRYHSATDCPLTASRKARNAP